MTKSMEILAEGEGELLGNFLSIDGLVIVVASLLAAASWIAWLILVEEDV
jgi:hypothetical protein